MDAATAKLPPWTHPLLRGLPLALVAAVALLLWVPWTPEMPRLGLDASFRFALHELFLAGAQFGVDVVHQYGPWGFVANDHYHPGTYPLLLLTRAFLALCLAVLAWWVGRRCLGRYGRGLGLVWALAFVVLVTWFDLPYLMLPQLTLLAYTLGRGRERRILLTLAAPALALATLVKFNYLLMIAATLGVVGAVALLAPVAGRMDASGAAGAGAGDRRAACWLLGGWAAGVLGFWVLAGQSLLHLPRFLLGGLHLTATYGESHALPGPFLHAVGFAACAALFALAVAWSEGRRRGLWGLSHAAVLTVFLLVAFKHAFVRHDVPHGAFGVMYGFAAVLLWGVVALAGEGEGGVRSRRRTFTGALAAVVLAGFCSFLLFGYGWPASHLAHLYGERLMSLGPQLGAAARTIAAPHRHRAEHAATFARLRAEFPLPPLPGTVDLYPYSLPLLFAHDLEYQPRPTLQSYQASDRWLAEQNARALAAGDGPDHLVVGIAPIDNRLAPMDDSLSWPHFLAGYDRRQAENSLVILDRAAAPRSITWGEPRTLTTTWNSWVELDTAPDRLEWLEAEIHPTFLGSLTGLFFREPQIYFSVRYPDGTEKTFRYLPEVGRAGFLLSPLVETWVGFANLYDAAGREELAAQQIVAVHFILQKTWSFERDVELRLRTLEIGG